MSAGATWRDLLRDAVREAGKGGISKVASQLGVSRTAVSLLLADKYDGKTDRMAARVLARFGQGRVMCPHMAAEIGVADCARWRRRPQPTSDANALRHWQACRGCSVGKALEQGATAEEANRRVSEGGRHAG